MLVTEVSNALPGGSSLLRNEPVQARISARLAGLSDEIAARLLHHEVGPEVGSSSVDHPGLLTPVD